MKTGDKVRIVGEEAKKTYPEFARLEGIVTEVDDDNYRMLPVTVDFGVIPDSTHKSLGYFYANELEITK